MIQKIRFEVSTCVRMYTFIYSADLSSQGKTCRYLIKLRFSYGPTSAERETGRDGEKNSVVDESRDHVHTVINVCTFSHATSQLFFREFRFAFYVIRKPYLPFPKPGGILDRCLTCASTPMTLTANIIHFRQ